MHFLFKTLLALFPFFFYTYAKTETSLNLPRVLVSVAPHKYFVEKIAENTLVVDLIVPAGASSHTFEPTPKQMMDASKACIWFQIGESFEPRATQAIRSYHPELVIVSLQQGLELIFDAEGMCSCHAHRGAPDLHFWLSPRMAQIQAETIAHALSKTFPWNQELYMRNLNLFKKDLQELDQKIREILSSSKKVIFVSHPAYAYFARDYGLRQISIEFEGKDPTPQQLTRLIQTAKQEQIDTIYIQMQYPSKGAQLIAQHIGAQLVTLDPYAENFCEAMLHIAKEFGR